MKLVVPDNLKGKELFKFLAANKSQLIATKKAALKTSDPLACSPSFVMPTKDAANKAASPVDGLEDTGTVNVKIVGNAAWWCDSHMDVLTDKCYDKSIKEKGILIPHIADHIHKSTSHVGDVTSVYTQSVSLKDLGLSQVGTTTAFVTESTVRKDYNPDTYRFYKMGKINQHSLGLIYVSIGLCINDKDYLPEFELWNKYYDKIINKELVDERGYFWIVPEIKIMEVSCVLFGANELTPTLDIKTDTTPEPSSIDTPPQPSPESTEKYQVIDLFKF